MLDGYGGNSWRQVTTASGKAEAEKCPSITRYEYADGQGDTQKSISDIKSMAAKGVDALVVFGDAGPAVLPAITSVYKSGKVIVPYRVDVGGKAGENYTKFVGASFVTDGVSWGNWIKSVLPKGGNLLFLSGPAGNSQGLDELKGLKSVLGPEYVFVNPAPFAVTNWDPALTQKVLTAEIAKHDKIDVIVSDFGPSLVGALPLFSKSGKSIPALATSDGNSLGCFWTDNQKDNPGLQAFHGCNRQRQRPSGRAVGRCFGNGWPTADGGGLQGACLRRLCSRANQTRLSVAKTFPVRSICRLSCRTTNRQKPSASEPAQGPRRVYTFRGTIALITVTEVIAQPWNCGSCQQSRQQPRKQVHQRMATSPFG